MGSVIQEACTEKDVSCVQDEGAVTQPRQSKHRHVYVHVHRQTRRKHASQKGSRRHLTETPGVGAVDSSCHQGVMPATPAASDHTLLDGSASCAAVGCTETASAEASNYVALGCSVGVTEVASAEVIEALDCR